MNPAIGPDRLVTGEEVTVLEGSSFCRSGRTGDIDPRRAQGLFVKDTRILSTWDVRVDDEPLSVLAVLGESAFGATFVCRAQPRTPGTDPSVVVQRRRLIGRGLREDITVRNFGTEALGATLSLVVDSDFADLFAVKDGHPRRRGTIHRQTIDGQLEVTTSLSGRHRGIRIHTEGPQDAEDTQSTGDATDRGGTGDARITRTGISWQLIVPPHQSWTTTVHALPTEEGIAPALSFPADRPLKDTEPSQRQREWVASLPHIECENDTLQQAIQQSITDLASLRIQDPDHRQETVIAAGAPWFMTLFGRDCLLTSMMVLPWDVSLAGGTLRALARRQGTRVEPLSEEEPGKILHEVRSGLDESIDLGGSGTYYGSIDSTPLFVIVLAQAAAWGLPQNELAELLPAADRALAWIEHYGDLDGDGFVEYQRKTDRGLLNQGWKDSHDSITNRNGTLAHGPIALAEVQGYVYAAYQARAHLATLQGDTTTAMRYRAKAQTLQHRFEDAFWLPEHDYYALALDGEKRPVDALASNQGHCLWTGIASADHAAAVAEHLLSPAMFTGWGVRTLATGMAAYNPISYHNGSVWPHDNAITVAGLARYGHTTAAGKIATALIEASAAFNGRLPELFCGFNRAALPAPIRYPTACSPQAWAAATPLALITALLGLHPDAEHGRIHAVNALPDQWGRIRITGMSVAGHAIDVDSDTLPTPGPRAVPDPL
jgi:glycogen debranching enzyme